MKKTEAERVLEERMRLIREDGFKDLEDETVEPCSNESIFTKIVEALAEMPELYGYVLGVVATLSSILAVVINYNFYGKIYEYRHKKK